MAQTATTQKDPLTEFPKPPSMKQLLSLMTAIDEGMATVDIEDMKAHMDHLEDKADGYKYVLDKFDQQISWLDQRIKELQDSKKSLQTRQKGLRDHLAWTMENEGFEKLRGKRYSVSLVCRKKLVVTDEASSAYYARHRDLVKRKYEWDKTALKKAVEKGDDGLPAHIDESKYPRFTVKKELN